ncbi:hypothetical protein ACRAWD_01945 [Caulobacter segnis]
MVGTRALMVSKDGWVELTKMGVLKSARGLEGRRVPAGQDPGAGRQPGQWTRSIC